MINMPEEVQAWNRGRAEWYGKNADRIVFDPAKGKYVLKK